MTTKITTYKQLINYIRTNSLSVEQASKLFEDSLIVWVNSKDYKTTEDLIKATDKFWEQYKNVKEKPLFLDLDKFEIGQIYNEDSDFYSKVSNLKSNSYE